MKKYLISYFKDTVAKTDVIYLYKDNLSKLSNGNIGIELISELKWIEKTDNIVLINFWEVIDET